MKIADFFKGVSFKRAGLGGDFAAQVASERDAKTGRTVLVNKIVARSPLARALVARGYKPKNRDVGFGVNLSYVSKKYRIPVGVLQVFVNTWQRTANRRVAIAEATKAQGSYQKYLNYRVRGERGSLSFPAWFAIQP